MATPLTAAVRCAVMGPASDGRILVTHLGVGLADLVFADALLHAAESRGAGVELA